MAYPTRLRGEYISIRSRLSRLIPETYEALHGYPASGCGLPADHVEVVYSGGKERGKGLETLLNHLTDLSKIPSIGLDDYETGGLIIFIGGTDAHKMSDTKWHRLMREIDKKALVRKRSVLFVAGEGDQRLLDAFDAPSVFDYSGYRDYGIKYGPYRTLGIIPDAACFWDSSNEIGTVVIPKEPTVAGINRVSTVMRKSDILITHYPPYAMVSKYLDRYSESDIKNSILVEEAVKIWEPDLHLYGGHEIPGRIYSYGSKRAMGLGWRKHSPVVRWKSGDLEKGPIEGPGGYN